MKIEKMSSLFSCGAAALLMTLPVNGTAKELSLPTSQETSTKDQAYNSICQKRVKVIGDPGSVIYLRTTKEFNACVQKDAPLIFKAKELLQQTFMVNGKTAMSNLQLLSLVAQNLMLGTENMEDLFSMPQDNKTIQEQMRKLIVSGLAIKAHKQWRATEIGKSMLLEMGDNSYTSYHTTQTYPTFTPPHYDPNTGYP